MKKFSIKATLARVFGKRTYRKMLDHKSPEELEEIIGEHARKQQTPKQLKMRIK